MLRIRFERLKRGWTLQTLGFHAQIQATDISKIERGLLKPYPGQAQRLAEALGVRREELLDQVEDKVVCGNVG
jgi:ribosome-binding protein aMBF1 (putative translation factor)